MIADFQLPIADWLLGTTSFLRNRQLAIGNAEIEG